MTKEVKNEPEHTLPTLVDLSKIKGGKAENLVKWDTWKDQIEKIHSGEIKSQAAMEFLKEIRDDLLEKGELE